MGDAKKGVGVNKMKLITRDIKHIMGSFYKMRYIYIYIPITGRDIFGSERW